MSDPITTLFVDEFNNDVQLLSQQLKSRFRGTTMESSQNGEGARAVDQFGEVEAGERTSRHQDIVVTDTPTDARWEFPRDFFVDDIVDTEDKLRLKLSPEGFLMAVQLAAMNRKWDDEIITRFFADSKTGRDGSATTVFPASQVIAVTVGSAGDTGMNTDKLLAGRKKMIANEVDLENPLNTLFCAISAQQEEDLIKEIRVGNKDFRDRAVFDDPANFAGLQSWFGINLVPSERLLKVGLNRRNPMWAKSGMHMGVWKDIQGDIRRLPDKVGNPFLVEVTQTVGGTRTEEKKVVEILSKEP